MHEPLPPPKQVHLLNHGLISLVSFTQPVERGYDERGHIRDGWTGDLEVVRNARTSYAAAWRTGEDAGKDAKLLNYLVEHQHTSPLESVSFTFEVKAPIFVLRQWHRHRTWAFSEISGRYAALPEEFYVPEVSQITTQSDSNKQMRTDELHPQADLIQEMIMRQCYEAFSTYHKLLEMGCPRELARTVLPLATYSHMFATVNLLNLMKFCKLRIHGHAQYEIRVYAQAMMDMARSVCPVVVGAVERHWL
jgi:thymidylate synthase (FAD)